MTADVKRIGLTGSIASGKSAVRQYLENEGLLTIDADVLAQATYYPGMPAYKSIVKLFGSDICYADGQINRSKLGRIVFSDPAALTELEALIHPEVTRAIEKIISRTKVDLVVIEAIKLFESDLYLKCDEVWVTAADDQVRFERLIQTRGLSESDAVNRIKSQTALSEITSRACYVIRTDISFEFTYQQTLERLYSPKLNHKIPSFEMFANDVIPLKPEVFHIARSAFPSFFNQRKTDEDIYKTLSQCSIICTFNKQEPKALISWKKTGSIAFIQNIFLRNLYSQELIRAIKAVETIADNQLCDLLILSQDLLSPKQAKDLELLTGATPFDTADSFFLTNFLQKHGINPREIYCKKIMSAQDCSMNR